jgi:hypothetical protein
LEPQVCGFLRAKAEHEIGGESVGIALDGLVELLGLYAVQEGEVGVEHDRLSTDQEYAALHRVGSDGLFHADHPLLYIRAEA